MDEDLSIYEIFTKEEIDLLRQERLTYEETCPLNSDTLGMWDSDFF